MPDSPNLDHHSTSSSAATGLQFPDLPTAVSSLEGLSSKQEQILQGAMRVFLQQGYANTSMDRIAAEAGVSKQTIYSHFNDKEGLFTALMERVTIRRLRQELQAEALQGTPERVLRCFAESFLTKMDDPEYLAFLRLVIAESARFPELAQLYTRTVIQYGYQTLNHYLMNHPELGISDTEVMARIFLGALAAFILSQEILHGKLIMPMPRERLINGLIACVLGSTRNEQVKDAQGRIE